jgi:hypothetical protein
MTRQTKDEPELKTSGVAARVTPSERRAFEGLRRKLGSAKFPLSEADTLRHAIALACQQNGVTWPAVDS